MCLDGISRVYIYILLLCLPFFSGSGGGLSVVGTARELVSSVDLRQLVTPASAAGTAESAAPSSERLS